MGAPGGPGALEDVLPQPFRRVDKVLASIVEEVCPRPPVPSPSPRRPPPLPVGPRVARAWPQRPLDASPLARPSGHTCMAPCPRPPPEAGGRRPELARERGRGRGLRGPPSLTGSARTLRQALDVAARREEELRQPWGAGLPVLHPVQRLPLRASRPPNSSRAGGGGGTDAGDVHGESGAAAAESSAKPGEGGADGSGEAGSSSSGGRAGFFGATCFTLCEGRGPVAAVGDEGGGVALHGVEGPATLAARAHPGPVLAIAERSVAADPSADEPSFSGTLVASASRGQVVVHAVSEGDGLSLALWAAAEGVDLGMDVKGCHVSLSPSGRELFACGASGSFYAFRLVPPPPASPPLRCTVDQEGEPSGAGMDAAVAEGGGPAQDGTEGPAEAAGRLVPLLAVAPGEASSFCPGAGKGPCTAEWHLKDHSLAHVLTAVGVHVWWEGCSQLVQLRFPTVAGRLGAAEADGGGDAPTAGDLPPTTPHKAWHLTDAITSSVLSSAGVYLACGLAKGAVVLLDTHCGAVVDIVTCGGSPVTSVCFTEAGSSAHLCAADRKGRLFIYDCENGRSSVRVLSKASFQGSLAGIRSESALLVAFCEKDGEPHLQVFNSHTKKHVAELKPSQEGREFVCATKWEPEKRMANKKRYLVVLERDAQQKEKTREGGSPSPSLSSPASATASDGAAGAPGVEEAGAPSSEEAASTGTGVTSASDTALTSVSRGDCLLVYDLSKRFAREQLESSRTGLAAASGKAQQTHGLSMGRNSTAIRDFAADRKAMVGRSTKQKSTMVVGGASVHPRVRGRNSMVVHKPARASMIMQKHRQATVFARRGASTTALDFEDVMPAIPFPREPAISLPSSTSSLLKGAAARQKRMDIRQEELTSKFLYDSAVKPCTGLGRV